MTFMPIRIFQWLLYLSFYLHGLSHFWVTWFLSWKYYHIAISSVGLTDPHEITSYLFIILLGCIAYKNIFFFRVSVLLAPFLIFAISTFHSSRLLCFIAFIRSSCLSHLFLSLSSSCYLFDLVRVSTFSSDGLISITVWFFYSWLLELF